MANKTILQSLALPVPDTDDALFLRDGTNCAVKDGTLEIGDGGEVDLDTLFNAFFIAPWERWTTLGNVSVDIDYSGDLAVAARRILSDKVEPIDLAQPGVNETRGTWQAEIWSRAADPGASGGRIALSLSSPTGASIHGLRFVTADLPNRPVRLSLGVCSYNRPNAIAMLVASLVHTQPAALHSVIIVEQGEQRYVDRPDRVCSLPDTDLVVLRQSNFGGAGGFTRTLCVALEQSRADADGPTHHVLMDDDAFAIPDQWTRLAAFLAFTTAELAVGAPMLELETPWRLHEAGIRFASTRRRRSIGRGLDARDRETLDQFAEPYDIDAHAWWCWCVPLATAATQRAPLNLFIKYDDIEYTHRLAKAGVPTVVLPGASVWHEAFANKPPDWRSFYTMRNETIFQALHQPSEAWRSSPVWNNIFPALLRHDYARVELLLDGLAQFMAGPEAALGGDPVLLHNHVMARHRSLRPGHVSLDELPDGDRLHPLRPKSPVLAVLAMLFGVSESQPSFVARSAFEPEPLSVGARSYVRAMPGATAGELMQHDRLRAWQLFARMLWTHLRFSVTRRRNFKRWQSCLGENGADAVDRSYQAWRQLFQKHSVHETALH